MSTFDLLVFAHVLTRDPARPRAQALLVRDGRVVATGGPELGAGAEVRRRLELPGRTVAPGLVDAHLHLGAVGRAREQVDLRGARDLDEVVERVRSAAASSDPDTFIIGRGWNQEEWAGEGVPDGATLSRAVPDRPVVLRRVDGHAALVNARTLALAGIGRDTPDPPGGRIARRDDGTPSGLLVDAAMSLLPGPPKASQADVERWLLAGQAACLELGLTSVHDAGSDAATVGAFESLARDGRLVLGGMVMLEADFDAAGRPAPWLAGRLARGPQRAGRMTFAAVKIYADGALGSRGAALLEPYCDDAAERGLLQLDRGALLARLRACREAGFQACVHAIGDAANRFVLDAMEEVLGASASEDHRWRIEHAQVVAPQDLPRFARLGVTASVQPVHATSDRHMAERRLGAARLQGAYAWRSLLRSGARLALGSDAPIEEADPWAGILAASARQGADLEPAGGWRAHEALTREEALDGFTSWAARAAFQDAELGSLAPGRRADFVVLDEDPLACAPARLAGLRPASTWIEGRCVHDAAHAVRAD